MSHMERPRVHSWRLKALILFLMGSGLGLTLRVSYLQIAQSESFRQQAQEEHWAKQSVLPHRGMIRDRNSYPLAATVTVFNLFLDTTTLRRPERVAQALSPLLERSEEELLQLMSRGQKEKVPLALGISYEKGREIQDLGLPGVVTEKEIKRVYPEGNMAAPLLGFVGRDSIGLTGIEADFNAELAGRSGSLIFERDSIGNPIPLGFRQLVPPEGGADLILTLDRYAQRLAEWGLDEAIKKHKASGGTIIIMEPRTGAILAMASRPSFDLTAIDLRDASRMELYRNRAITDMYEPGSVFKVVTMAAALEERLVTPKTTFYDNGFVVKYGWPIWNWDGKANGLIDMTEVLKRSANVGAIWVSDQLGPERFYKHVLRFGFGQPTYISLSGEASGQVRTHKDQGWSPVDLATNSFGQGISATPLQMITAVSAIANGGQLMRPYVVKQVVGPKGTRTYQPVVVRRVLSPEVAQQLGEMMHAAAEQGESKLAVVPGYKVGGKTGTASISKEGGYASEETIASFAGFAPLRDPKFAILVKIDKPQDSPWGSVVASPVFSSISSQLLIYMKERPVEPFLVQKRG